MTKPPRALIPTVRPRTVAPAAPVKPAKAALAGFISDNTKRAYERDLKDFFQVDALEGLPLERLLQVQPADVIAFRDRLQEEGKTPATICRKLSAIRSMYDHLRAAGLIDRNPADPKLVRSPRRATLRKTSPLTAAELRKLLNAPDRKTEMGKRDYAMLLLGAQAGLRREELCGMQDNQLSKFGDRWCVTIRGKGGKERRIPLHESVLAAIQDWQRVRPKNAQAMFCTSSGEPMKPGNFYKAVRRYAIQAGFDPDVKRVHPHSLRAAFATILHERGLKLKEIKELMGHARIDTTAGYIEESDLTKSEAPNLIAGALESESE